MHGRRGEMSRELVESRDEVLENVQAFNRGLKENEGLRNQLPYFRAWYYMPEIDMVGPSKFVGYKGMTVSEYTESYEQLDGRDTEPVLWKLFDEVDPHHGDWKREGRHVLKVVERLLDQYEKVPNKKARFMVPKEWTLDEKVARSPETGLWVVSNVAAPQAMHEESATAPQSDGGRVTLGAETGSMVEVFWRAFLTLYPDDQLALAERIERHLRKG
jgi:hypothetical protein